MTGTRPTRPAARRMPDDLSTQIAPLRKSIVAMGWPLLEVEGVEADDVIATLALEAERHGVRTVISSGDKELLSPSWWTRWSLWSTR